jgi:hypothetical protein
MSGRLSLTRPWPLRRPAASGTDEHSAVLVVTAEASFSQATIRRAAQLAAGEPVTVMVVARMHGSGLGLPHPGLLPTSAERESYRRLVAGAMAALEKLGCPAYGHISVTRTAARSIARIAKAREVRALVVEAHPVHPARRLIEGDLPKELRRRLRGQVTVEALGPAVALVPLARQGRDAQAPDERGLRTPRKRRSAG